jgi:hypothetical protein
MAVERGCREFRLLKEVTSLAFSVSGKADDASALAKKNHTP